MFCNTTVSSVAEENVNSTGALIRQLDEIKLSLKYEYSEWSTSSQIQAINHKALP
jgi:hypothetical protein